MTFTRTNRVSTSVVALLTVVSLLASAFPAPFFVAAQVVDDASIIDATPQGDQDTGDTPGDGDANPDELPPENQEAPAGDSEAFTASKIVESFGNLRVCKIVLDQQGVVGTGAGVDADFSIRVTGPQGFDQTVDFSTALTLTDDLVTDNGTDLDAACVTLQGVAVGEYRYAEEKIDSAAVWATPRYHDFYNDNPPVNLSSFTAYAVDGSAEDNDDNDGVANVGKNKTRTIAVVNQIERLPLPPVCENGENLLANGSFEQPNPTKNKAFGGTWEIFSNVIGWVVPAAGLEIWNGLYGGASHGVQNAELDGNQSVAISQTIATIPGATYEIKFDFTPRPGRAPADNNVEARVNGGMVLNATGTGIGLTENDWKTYSTTFVATGATTEISFADMGTSNSFGGAIDNTAVCFVRAPKVVENTCILPDSAETEDDFVLGTSNEPSLQTIFNNNGFSDVDALDDQIGTEVWNFADSDTATVDLTVTLLAKHAGNNQAFGYYEAGNGGSFVPVFKVGAHAAAVPTLAPGGSLNITIPMNAAESLGFALSSTGQTTGQWFTEAALSTAGEDNVAVYNPDDNTYLLAFEDRSVAQKSDNDHNDLVVKISNIRCTEGGATVIAHKIVCDDETDLPNYGTGQGVPSMTANTAADWVANHDSCRLVSGWEFEWTANQSNDPGDSLTGTAGAPWTTFGQTDATGMTSVVIPASQLKKQNKLWFREVLQDGYIPFTHQAQGNKNTDNVSAEFYCHTDVLNYDNREFIDKMKVGETYHCVAWNVPEAPAQCVLDIYSDESTLVEETNKTAVATYDGNKAWTAVIPGATWIWATEQVENPKSEETYTFVETFEVTNPTVGTLVVAYDNWLKLTVNGTVVEDRKVNGYQDYQKQPYNILPYLVSGENRIEFEVKNLALNNGNYRNNPAGVLFHLSVEGAPESCDRTTESEVGLYTIEGFKYGVAGQGVIGMPNWNIYIENSGIASTVAAVTDETGYYSVMVPAGTWVVNEEVKAGYDQIEVRQNGEVVETEGSNNGYCNFTVTDDAEAEYRCDFYNELTGVEDPRELITACKFDSNEDGVEGWGMTITNGTEEGTYELTTGQNGCVSQLVDPTDGPWEVYEEDRAGWNFVEHYAYNGAELFSETQVPFCRFFGEDNGNYETASLTFYESEEYQIEYYCDFYNEQENVTPDPDPDPEPQSRRRSSSGSRPQEPEARVAGAATQCIILEDFMQIAWDNNPFEVLKLQIFLNTYLGLDMPLNGDFDQTVADAVMRFQEQHHDEIIKPWFERGIVPHDRPTGFVYKTTRWKINDILCPGVEPYPSFDGENLLQNVVIR